MKSALYCRISIALICFWIAIPVFSQFPAGTLIGIGEGGLSNDYDFKDQLSLGDLKVDYRQAGKYTMEEGNTVLIAYSGGFMQNFDYSQGKIKVDEKITIRDTVISREIIYEDGIPSVNTSTRKYTVKEGFYVDLNYLWIELKQEKTIPELAGQISAKEYKIRMETVQTLATLGQPAFYSLVDALADSSANIRECAAIALGELKDSRASKPLIVLLNDKNWFVRWRAAWALGEMKDNRAVEPLITALKDDDDWVKKSADKSLERITSSKFDGNADKWKAWYESHKIEQSAGSAIQAKGDMTWDGETGLFDLKTKKGMPVTKVKVKDCLILMKDGSQVQLKSEGGIKNNLSYSSGIINCHEHFSINNKEIWRTLTYTDGKPVVEKIVVDGNPVPVGLYYFDDENFIDLSNPLFVQSLGVNESVHSVSLKMIALFLVIGVIAGSMITGILIKKRKQKKLT